MTGSVARRPPSSNQREPSGSVAPAPIQPYVYSLNQQEARDAPDMVTDVFSKELVSLPPDRDVEFFIDVFSGTASISKDPYRLIPKELRELKVQLQESMDRGFVLPGVSPWGAPILFLAGSSIFSKIDLRSSYYQLKNRLWVPMSGDLRKEILYEAHYSGYTIHPGSSKIYGDMQSTFWWHRLKKDTTEFILKCEASQLVKAEHQ
ncbi:uncharacterized protein LOC114581137 [Dendrobium catenatum]|uniref:uncharacterized protein LOC114581137 n=1 Tax=Dendrobium catenatum TaxID=906689 RepID=UPI00109FC59E|nr:uncharacterized protein LOC114581137 [Dendrobium catenatum]